MASKSAFSILLGGESVESDLVVRLQPAKTYLVLKREHQRVQLLVLKQYLDPWW